MDELLFLLLKNKAQERPFKISTTMVGKLLGMSQQNASRRIHLLELEGKIIRSSSGISISETGLEEIFDLYSELKNIFEGKKEQLILTGKIVDGFGEGKYYITKYSKKIKNKLGWIPYPGTLNIRLDKKSIDKRKLLLRLEPIIINDFKEDGRKYGGLFLYKCKINKIACILLVPMRTHHGREIIEIISEKNLRKKLGAEPIKIEVDFTDV